MRMCHTARSASGFEAHELGGGVGAAVSPRLPSDDGDLGGDPGGVDDANLRGALVPEHREVGVDHLVGGRQVQPDLEELTEVARVLVDERKHLAVLHALAGGHPLGVAVAEAGGGPHRVGVIDQAVAHMGDGLEASVRMLGEARHPAAVVHRPAVLFGEVVTQGATGELLRGRTEVIHAFGVVVSVMGDEQEGVDRGPLGTQRKRLEYGGHGLGAHAPANVPAGRSISILNDLTFRGGVRRNPAPDES